MKLSILIKTFNEEAKILKCLDSVLAATRTIQGGVEVIVADALSADASADIASAYGVMVVQLRDPVDRGCGTGVQLGFQYARGEYVYLLDGDMELDAQFLHQALELIEHDRTIAGVAGLLRDKVVRNWFDRDRQRKKTSAMAGDFDFLSGGGLYRRSAITNAGGYAGNRNLKAFEEAELGLRLRSQGWRLVRLAIPAISHTGHADSTFAVIARHWRSGRFDSCGVLLKTALGQAWFGRATKMFIHPLALLGYWAVFLPALLLAKGWAIPLGLAALGAVLYLALAHKKGSLVDAAYSVVLWHASALGILRGAFFQSLHAPSAEIPSTVLSKGACSEYWLEEQLVQSPVIN